MSKINQSLIAVQQLDNEGKYEDALELIENLELWAPKDPRVQVEKTFVFVSLGDHEAAKESIQTALSLGVNPAYGITEALIAPEVPESVEEIRGYWSTVCRRVIELRSTNTIVQNPLAFYRTPLHFRFSYYGQDVKNFHRNLAELYLKFSPGLSHTAPYCLPSAMRGPGPARVGIVLGYGKDHAMGRAFGDIIDNLMGSGFEVKIFNYWTDAILGKYGESVNLPTTNLAQAWSVIESFQPDILLFTEIGMQALSYFLAFARLARVQCAMGGHPVTTGIRNVDYFISMDLAEPADADEHYTEQLIRLGGTSPATVPDVQPHASETLDKLFASPEKQRIYYCPHIYFKMHPAYDKTLSAILEADPEGQVLIWGSKRRNGEQKLKQRFAQTLGENASRVIFHPVLAPGIFLALLGHVDVVLDNPYFGLGTTAFFALKAGVPVVTQKGAYLRSGVASCIYRVIGLEELITESEEQFVKTSVALATDTTRNTQLREKIRSKSHLAFENKQFNTELVSLFRSFTKNTNISA